MSATESGQRIRKPNVGPWNWRAYGPACRCELDDLARRALLADPDGIDVERFLYWVEDEFSGSSRPKVPHRPVVLAKFRRFLYDLHVDEPMHPAGVDVSHLPCGFDPKLRTQHRSIKEPHAGPWDWQRLIPECACELDSLRIRAGEASVRRPDRGINLGRFLRWVEGQAKGEDLGPRGVNALARYRRFLYELNVDHEPVHGPDVDVSQLPCSFGGVAETAENPCSTVGSVKLVAAAA